MDEEKSRVGRKGEDCTMLHVTLGHYHNRQATSHPKAMPHHHIRRQIYNIFHTFASSLGNFWALPREKRLSASPVSILISSRIVNARRHRHPSVNSFSSTRRKSECSVLIPVASDDSRRQLNLTMTTSKRLTPRGPRQKRTKQMLRNLRSDREQRMVQCQVK